MAIKKISEEKNNNNVLGRTILIENGDLEALKAIVDSYGFKDEESALRFSLALLTTALGKSIVVEDDSDRQYVKPSNSLLKEKSK